MAIPCSLYVEGPLSGALVGRVDSTNTLLARIIWQQGLHCTIDPNAFFENINPNLRPQYPELQNGLLDVLLESPRVTVVLRKLLTQARPRNNGLTLSAIAPIDEEC